MGQLHVRLPDDLHMWFDVNCRLRKTTMNTVLKEMVEELQRTTPDTFDASSLTNPFVAMENKQTKIEEARQAKLDFVLANYENKKLGNFKSALEMWTRVLSGPGFEDGVPVNPIPDEIIALETFD